MLPCLTITVTMLDFGANPAPPIRGPSYHSTRLHPTGEASTLRLTDQGWDRSRGVDLDHEFNRTWLAACHRVLKPAGAIWVSGTLHIYLSVGMAMQQLGFRI